MGQETKQTEDEMKWTRKENNEKYENDYEGKNHME